jgi:hypothetical protein
MAMRVESTDQNCRPRWVLGLVDGPGRRNLCREADTARVVAQNDQTLHGS